MAEHCISTGAIWPPCPVIARRVRECGVYCEIYPFDVGDDEIRDLAPRGVILSGGPESVTDHEPPAIPESIFELGE